MYLNRAARRALKKKGVSISDHNLLIDLIERRRTESLLDLIDYQIEHDMDCTEELRRLYEMRG